MTERDKVVVVGGGQAGFQLAASLRARGDGRPILLISEEKWHPYQRPPLSKSYLDGKVTREALNLRSPAFYSEQNIEFLAGRRVVAVNRTAKHVLLAGGRAIGYSHLVLATGARNRILPIPGRGLRRVIQLRTVDESERIAEALADAKHVAVIGAGFVGLEFAATAAARGLDVTVIEAASRPMARALSREMSEIFRVAHAVSGIKFVFDASTTRLIGDGERVVAVETATGTFEADVVVIGIGVVPNVELAADAGLAVADGIVVDQNLATSDPAISAIGDCARFPSRFAANGEARIESVQNAVDHARVLAARLAGQPLAYDHVPWFWSDQGPLKLQIAGLATPHDTAVVKSDANGVTAYCFRGNRLVGVETLNRPAEHMAARMALGASVVPTLEDVRGPRFDLRSYVKTRGVA